MPKNCLWQLKKLKRISEDKINYIMKKAALRISGSGFFNLFLYDPVPQH